MAYLYPAHHQLGKTKKPHEFRVVLGDLTGLPTSCSACKGVKGAYATRALTGRNVGVVVFVCERCRQPGTRYKLATWPHADFTETQQVVDAYREEIESVIGMSIFRPGSPVPEKVDQIRPRRGRKKAPRVIDDAVVVEAMDAVVGAAKRVAGEDGNNAKRAYGDHDDDDSHWDEERAHEVDDEAYRDVPSAAEVRQALGKRIAATQTMQDAIRAKHDVVVGRKGMGYPFPRTMAREMTVVVDVEDSDVDYDRVRRTWFDQRGYALDVEVTSDGIVVKLTW